MADPAAPHILRLADLSARRPTRIDIALDADDRARIAENLGIPGIGKLEMTGTLSPEGRTDWHLDALLKARAQQICVVSLQEMTTRIEEPVDRRFVKDYEEPDTAGEIEMPEDDTVEPLGSTIDLPAVMQEALALALPPFPRKPGVELGEAVFTEPGKAPMTDADAKPLAPLAALKARLERGDPDEGN